ncbi:PDR/VanB family oxidoreductase [Actinoplanes derwentensis]|uniref:Ferredoxin-NADP reductase n=1 Tax=Actinoplanes derwentensis TaxID=113562 RepID=A0A1H1ZJB0_9ACTN|nr:PDR/VanB family oxidoreductase [Actinoplanes derwentensis]GID82451.1 ferredoxin [Actinoplanes derwentensis]SDT33296.1 Ferredoxin-NADP reductase [Actinoplanes derwentensis]
MRELMVRGLVLEADDVLTVDLVDPAGAVLPDWAPGAHVDLVVSDGSVRQYSLCGVPGGESLTIAVRHDPAGKGGSGWVHRTVRPGDRVTMRGVKNHFALEDAPEVVLIAGGVGITPLLPMAEELARGSRAWRLAYVGRKAATMPFVGRVRALGSPAAIHETAVSGRPSMGDLLAGVTSETLVYVCGPASLIEAVEKTLEAEGRGDCLRAEYFEAPELEVAEPGSFTLRLEKSGLELAVPAGRSALEVVTEAGIDVLSDCEEGICGTCDTRVLAGEVDHRDHVLTRSEKAANNCMMLCVSRAAGPRLVIDL